MSDPNIEILRKKTYIKSIENSVGSRIFNSLYVHYKDTGKTVDILNDGEYSCAFFVSSILLIAGLMDKPHATVKSLKDIIGKSDKWNAVENSDIQPGDVVFYEKLKFENGTENAHVGFALDKSNAVSTSYETKVVAKHPVKNRKIEVVYRYSMYN